MASIAASLASVCLSLSIVLLSIPRTHDVRTVAMLCRRANERGIRRAWERALACGKGDADEVTGQRPKPHLLPLILSLAPPFNSKLFSPFSFFVIQSAVCCFSRVLVTCSNGLFSSVLHDHVDRRVASSSHSRRCTRRCTPLCVRDGHSP